MAVRKRNLTVNDRFPPILISVLIIFRHLSNEPSCSLDERFSVLQPNNQGHEVIRHRFSYCLLFSLSKVKKENK